ncbi:MAG: PD-(D/E)XK nuclease-like domain-containing protein [Gemmatimonadaceae bacterium]|nr:PD-(D/E)XK nuclease-like domain-containing protein [Gemmatimonadaceae bacterium]
MTLAPGIHVITADAYHRDDVCDQPSLSASLAHILCTSSPAHARIAHPRLNPDFERHEEEKFDTGTVAHALLLQGEDVAVIVDAPDWRTNAAKEERDAARAAGQIPLLAKHWDAVRAMVAATREQLDKIEVSPALFTDGKPEQTLIWEDDGVMCRARIDWLHDDLSAIDDYKTSKASANPESWSRTLFGIGADMQVAFYLRGLAAVAGAAVAGMADWRFVVQETYPPYALSVVSLSPDVLALADAKVEWAIQLWKQSLASGEWPAYPTRVCWAELPPWEEARWMEREAREAA